MKADTLTPLPLMPLIGPVRATQAASTLRLKGGKVSVPERDIRIFARAVKPGEAEPTEPPSPEEYARAIPMSAMQKTFRHLHEAYVVDLRLPIPDGASFELSAFRLLQGHLLMRKALDDGEASLIGFWSGGRLQMDAVRLDPAEADWALSFRHNGPCGVGARYTPAELRRQFEDTITAISSGLEQQGVDVTGILKALPPQAPLCGVALRRDLYMSTPPSPPDPYEW